MLQTDRMATLFLDVLRSYVSAGRFRVNDFVVMRDHIHLIITLGKEMSVEKAVQLIKGQLLISREEGAELPRRDLAAGLL